MTSSGQTDDLIQSLSQQAGPRRGLAAIRFSWLFPAAVAAALAASMGTILIFIGVRPHLAQLAAQTPFLFKIACTLSLVIAGVVLARRAAEPGRIPPMLLLALAPSGLLLMIGGMTDRSGLSAMGRHPPLSAPGCVAAILLASAPALLLIVGALRSGAPTRPRQAGAIAGLLAGALGATAYALACVNDGRMFVAIWYPAAILIVACAGALIGKRALTW